MKKIILILAWVILISGCAQKIIEEQPEEIPAEQPRKCGNEGDFCGGIAGIICCEGLTCQLDGNYPDAGGICAGLTKKTETVGQPNTKKLEVYNPETGKTEIVDNSGTEIVEGAIASKGDDLLKVACKDSVNDYPDWAKSSTDIIIWEDPDKSFYFRNSPEDISVGLSPPVQTSETLADMDFLGLNEISYVKTKDNKWQIGLFKLKGLDVPDNSVIYEKSESASSIDISPINKNEFIVFYVKGAKAFLEYLDTSNSKEEILFETSEGNGNRKVAVSPEGTYVYLLYDKALRLFDISKKSKIDDINSVSSAVWIGNSHLLYSNSEGTYTYGIVSKNSDKITGINTAEVLAFNPKSEGIIAYTSNSKTKIVNCQNWKISLGSYETGTIETLTSEKTAILNKEDLSNSGYWRFEGDWYVKLSDNFSVLATVWNKY
ncbi:MAG: hypothetical protein Q8O03_03690 [Nanoarchaeota archaeon]|nr:hypothetical protein [Nanoarchaeota archaeon]